MQLTLVSHYGEKPPALASLCDSLQSRAAALLGNAFVPYDTAQIHGTIVGVEGERTDGRIVSANFSRHRNIERHIDFTGLCRAARAMQPFEIRLGGFGRHEDFGFTSNGSHSFLRSFSLQGEIAVAMGWPWSDGRHSGALFDFRKSIEKFGVLHKWHRRESDRDNDFFFVLGRVNRAGVTDERVVDAEEALRSFLADSDPVQFSVTAGTLSFVAYTDSQLPCVTSRAWRVTDPRLTGEMLAAVYD